MSGPGARFTLPGVRGAGRGLVLATALAACDAPADREPAPGPGPASADTQGIASETPGDSGWTLLGRLPRGAEEVTLTFGPRAVHALWVAETAAGRALFQAALPGGATDTLLAGWATLRSPRLAASNAHGFVAAIVGSPSRSDEPSVRAATVREGPLPRALSGDIDPTGPAAVVVDREDAAIFAWPTGAGTRIAFGMTPEHAPFEIPFCCDADLALAVDGDGSIVLAGAVEGEGLSTMTVLPADDGAFDVPDSRAAATADGGARYVLAGPPGEGSVYVVYCGGTATCDGVRAWRHGARPNEPAIYLAPVPGRVTALAAAATDDGRLWGAWTDTDSVRAVRTARAGAPRAGGRVAAPLPAPGAPPLALAAAAADGALRVIVAGREGDAVAIRERLLLPGLTVMPPALPPPLDVDARLRLVVEDAGEPVAGARVRALGAEATTDARGAVELPLAAGVRTDTLPVHVEAPGYTPLETLFHAERP
ncbi:MAG TPA: hypothetical protein VK837_14420 [Longimicrobiales bacterium]|nr:hypothetical protein [Longimicrobiales bacterium]